MNQEKLAKLQAQVRIGGKVLSTSWHISFSVGVVMKNVQVLHLDPVFGSAIAHFMKFTVIPFLLTSAVPLSAIILAVLFFCGPQWLCSYSLWELQTHTRWQYLLFLLGTSLFYWTALLSLVAVCVQQKQK